MPSIFCEASAAATPVDMPSFIASTASTLLLVWVRICSIAACARSGFQFSMFCLATTLIWPLSIRGFRTSICPSRNRLMIVMAASPSISAQLPLSLTLTMASAICAADRDVVEGNEGHVGGVDRHVIGDDRHVGGFGLRDSGHDRLRILGENDRGVALGGQQAVDVGHLLLRIALGVGAHVGVAGRAQHGLDPRFIDPPALFLEVAPADADALAVLRIGFDAGLQSETEGDEWRRRASIARRKIVLNLIMFVPPYAMALKPSCAQAWHIVTDEGRECAAPAN